MENNQQIKEFFDALAPNWDKENKINDRVDFLLDMLNIKKGDRILDAACGTGIISKKLYERSKRKVTAIDLSTEMIKEAKKKNISTNEVEFFVQDFYKMEKDDYDYVIIYNAYPHFLDLKLFKENLTKILSNNGKFAILHSLGRKQLSSCHKGREVSLLSRELFDPIKESIFYEDDFNILKAQEDENYYLIIGEKKERKNNLISIKKEEDKREIKTKRIIYDSFFSLLKNKNYSKLTISDILNNSNISRSTFYSHFKSKDEIIEEYLKDMLEHVCAFKLKSEKAHDFSNNKDAKSLITHLYCHLLEEKDYLNYLLVDDVKPIFINLLSKEIKPLFISLTENEIIKKDKIEKQVLTNVIISVFISLYIQNIEVNYPYNADELSEMFFSLLS